MEALFKTISIGSVTSKNRIVMAPMVCNLADEDDQASEAQVAYYGERARGGVGAIIVEASAVDRQAKLSTRQLGLYDDRFIDQLSELASIIKSLEALAFIQLCHGGPKAPAELNGVQPVSASPIPIMKGEMPKELDKRQIGGIIESFARAARRAKAAGFDGVEIHAGHFYLLGAFLSRYSNARRDEYGGSIMNRSRIACLVVERIKDVVGTEFPVICRINGRETLTGGLTVKESCKISTFLEQAGADAIDVSAYAVPINPSIAKEIVFNVGSIPLKDTSPGCFLPYAAEIKRAVKIPVVAVGRLNDPQLAGEAIDSQKCDMVAVGRQLIVDPYWPEKVHAGRLDDIVECTYCMACHTSQQRGKPMVCAENSCLTGPPVWASD